jgi:hypothetical protein
MTELYTPRPSLYARLTNGGLWWKRPRIIKVHVYPGRIISGEWPQDYDEWILLWGGKWRWRIRREES